MLLHAINYKCHPDSLQFVSFPAPCDSAGAVLIFRRNPCEAGEGSEEKLEFIPVCHRLVVLWRPEAQIYSTPLSYLNWKHFWSACHGILSDNPYLTCWEILLPLSLPIPALIFFFSFLFLWGKVTLNFGEGLIHSIVGPVCQGSHLWGQRAESLSSAWMRLTPRRSQRLTTNSEVSFPSASLQIVLRTHLFQAAEDANIVLWLRTLKVRNCFSSLPGCAELL